LKENFIVNQEAEKRDGSQKDEDDVVEVLENDY
jgi:hypothetical protein